MTLECGKQKRLPLAPAESSTAAMDAAMPTQMVETCGLIKFMVSRIARPEYTSPPGELM